MWMKTKIQQTPNRYSPAPVTAWLVLTWLLLLTCLPAIGLAQPSSPQQTPSPPPTTAETFSGTITEVKPSELSVRLQSGLVQRYAIQDVSARAVSVTGKAYNIPADIEVAGELPMKLIERGMVVRFKARCTVDGKYQGLVQIAQLVNEPEANSDLANGSPTKKSDNPMEVNFLERPADNATAANVEVVGRVQSFAGNQLYLHVQPAQWAPQGRIKFEFAADAKLSLQDRSLERVVAGDSVRLGQALAFETGERVIQRIRIQATGKRESLTKSFHGKLENKFRHLSNQPSKPREMRSAHFVLQTDLSDRSATILLAKLETMHELTFAGNLVVRLSVTSYAILRIGRRNWTRQVQTKFAKDRGSPLPSGWASKPRWSCTLARIIRLLSMKRFMRFAFRLLVSWGQFGMPRAWRKWGNTGSQTFRR